MTDTELCGCMKCFSRRADLLRAAGVEFNFPGPGVPGWRYACELCDNKRCPHHSDHELGCTRSNEPGQPGSMFA